MRKFLLALLCFFPFQVLSPGQVQAEPAKLPELSARLMLLVEAPAEKSFDKVSQVIFMDANNKPLPVVPEVMSQDLRTLSVRVPDQAIPGQVKVQKGTEITHTSTYKRPETPMGMMAWFPLVFFMGFLLLLACFLYLASQNKAWSLTQVLSELITRKNIAKDANGTTIYKLDVNGNKTEVLIYEDSEYTSSASRLIAFIGLFALIALIIEILVSAAYTGKLPEMKEFYPVLGTQLAAFVPYVANKVSGAFSGA